MAMRRRASQLNSDDLPTLGRPTMATWGTATAWVSCVDQRGEQGSTFPVAGISYVGRLFRAVLGGRTALQSRPGGRTALESRLTEPTSSSEENPDSLYRILLRQRLPLGFRSEPNNQQAENVDEADRRSG